MPPTTRSGIQTSADGTSVIPASQRADGSTRKEIRVRPGYKPPEDVEKYKSRGAEARISKGGGVIPGAEGLTTPKDGSESKSKNAKRREAARKKQDTETKENGELTSSMNKINLDARDKLKEDWRDSSKTDASATYEADTDSERQKKIRNYLKKLRAVRDLKAKKATGEKLSPDQLVKIGKEDELLRDLKKMQYDGPELEDSSADGTG